MTKYGFEISAANIVADINRLTNQLWKLIPMRENGEDWESQLQTAIIELAGLNNILNIDEQYLILLSKLEGLKVLDIDFPVYRKTVFESISLLRAIKYE
jgi:uncharacterized protein (DUF934 family)